jgi:hypothetical protein
MDTHARSLADETSGQPWQSLRLVYALPLTGGASLGGSPTVGGVLGSIGNSSGSSSGTGGGSAGSSIFGSGVSGGVGILMGLTSRGGGG